mmetsp:Transcript_97962/g.261503  ORF Transcript_97962/g.261503 Transcript_97962/m.261503 type:complete len:204 (-) Transcript_97962:238-849(-)
MLWAEMPDLVDEEDWLALAIVRCHRQCNFLWGCIEPVCHCSTAEGVGKHGGAKTCTFSAPVRPTTNLKDGAAKQFVSSCMYFLDERVKEQWLFAPEDGVKRDWRFRELCGLMAKRILQVYSHFELAHSEQMKEAGIWSGFRCQQRTMLGVVARFKLLDLEKMPYIVYKDWKEDELLKPVLARSAAVAGVEKQEKRGPHLRRRR